MKKILLGIMAAGVLFSSCDDFLTRNPGNKITPDDFFKNEREIELYANSFYERQMPDTDIAEGEKMTDIVVITTPVSYLTDGYSPTEAGGWQWSNLRNINYFINKVQESPVNADIKNKWIGVAKFWRAMFYFDKVSYFGGVPYYDTCLEPDDKEGLYKKRDSRAFVMEKVLEDLNNAIEYGSTVKDESCTYVTKYVALAYKSRVCLYEGTYRKYHKELGLGDSEKWLREAVSAAEELMESGTYKLHNTGNPDTDYRSLFTAIDCAGVPAIADEVIWAQVYDLSFRRWHDLTWKYNSGTYGQRWSLNHTFVNTYLMADGSRFTEKEGYETAEFSEELQNRDRRLKQTIRYPGYKRSNGKIALPDFAFTLNGYHMYKWSLDDEYFDSKKEATNAVPILRYAEVLLNYAEAKAELGEMTPIVWNKTIKALRERAGVKGTEPTEADQYLIDNFYPDINDKHLLEIRRERACELVGENLREDDLMRWKRGELTTMEWRGIYVPELNKAQDLDGDGKNDICFYKGSKPSISGVKFVALNESFTLTDGDHGNLIWAKGAERSWHDYKYLHPIPRNVRVLNPDLEQNPGWGE